MNFDAKLIVAYYLSNFGHEKLYPTLNQMQAFEKIASILKINKNGLKNIRDYYDANYRDIPREEVNRRKIIGRRAGWYQQAMPSSYLEVKQYYDRKSEDDVRADVMKILNLDMSNAEKNKDVQIVENKDFNHLKKVHFYIPSENDVIEINKGESGEKVTYNYLFSYCLCNASNIEYYDRYVHKKYQLNNLSEFIETIAKAHNGEPCKFYLETTEDYNNKGYQVDSLDQIKRKAKSENIDFSYHFVKSDSDNHQREIITNEWKILADKGIDIYEYYEIKNMYITPQKERRCIKTHIVYKKGNGLRYFK